MEILMFIIAVIVILFIIVIVAPLLAWLVLGFFVIVLVLRLLQALFGPKTTTYRRTYERRDEDVIDVEYTEKDE